MKNKFLFPVILFAGIMVINLSVNQVYGQTTQDKQVKQQTGMYICPTHSEVVQDKAGNCPKCGVKLVEKKDTSKCEMHQKKDSTCTKHDHEKMMNDSTTMKKCHMKQDSTSINHDHMEM
jgi:hypothetical protein